MSNAQYNPGLAELGRKNQPGGYVGISSGGDVLGTFAQRVDTAANLATIVLASGELAYASDTREVFIGDGVTAGGQFLIAHEWIKQAALPSGIGPMPARGSEDVTNSVKFHLVSPGSAYRLKVAIAIDGSPQSNFKVRSDFGFGFGPYYMPYWIWREVWWVSSTEYERFDGLLPAGYKETKLEANLNTSGASLIAEYVIMPRYTNDPKIPPSSFPVTVAVGTRDAGTSTSGSATIFASLQRIGRFEQAAVV